MKRISKEYIDAFLKDLHKSKTAPASNEPAFNINELINHGKIFYNDSIPVALEEALAHGQVATVPQLIASKALTDNNNQLWKNWYTALSEEVTGTHEGVEYYVIVHGEGILTPARIKQALNERLPNGSAKLTQTEFDSLLEGKINGEQITIYDFNKINEIQNPFGHYAIKIQLSAVKNTKSGQHTKEEFMNNPLVIMRNGGTQNLEAYFTKAQSSNKVGNWHNLENINAETPQARLLFFNLDDGGLSSYYILYGYGGRFLGVARTRNEGDRK